MGWWILFFIVVVIGSLFAIGMSNASAAAEKIVARQNEVQAEFPTDEFFMSELDGHFVGFSFERGVVVLGDMIFAKEYLFSEISSVEIIKNGSSVTTTNRGSQLLGAAVGGIALGGVGLLAGALTGSKKTNERVLDISLKITVDDNVRPLQVVKLFKSIDPKGTEPTSILIQPAITQADRLNAHFVNAMRKADQQRELPAPAAVPLLASSYGDQVKQLWELHQVGALTLEEYQDQKARLSQSA